MSECELGVAGRELRREDDLPPLLDAFAALAAATAAVVGTAGDVEDGYADVDPDALDALRAAYDQLCDELARLTAPSAS